MPSTTIRLDTEVRDRLRARGRMGESYNDVIRRLLDATRFSDGGSPPFGEDRPPVPSRPWRPLQGRE